MMGPQEPQEDYIETVLTCEGDFYDPEFHVHLEDFSQRLQHLIVADQKELILKKVEPWNSVRVTFNIPRDAAVRLRQLAEQGDSTLKELGILAVQIEGDRLISLTIAGKNNETTELVFQTTPPPSGRETPAASSVFDFATSEDVLPQQGPSNVEATRKNIAEYLRQQGTSPTALFESLLAAHQGQQQAGPNVGRREVPLPPHSGGKPSTAVPAVSKSPNHPGHIGHVPPFPFPSGQAAPGGIVKPTVSVSQASLASAQASMANAAALINAHAELGQLLQLGKLNNLPQGFLNRNMSMSSPLLVNLLQNEQSQGNQLNNFAKHLLEGALNPPPKKRKRQRKPKPTAAKGSSSETGDNPVASDQTGNASETAAVTSAVSVCSRVPPLPIVPGASVQQNVTSSGGDSFTLSSVSSADHKMTASSPASSQALSSSLHTSTNVTPALAQGAGAIHPSILQSTKATSSSSSAIIGLPSDTGHLINPYTGQFEPVRPGLTRQQSPGLASNQRQVESPSAAQTAANLDNRSAVLGLTSVCTSSQTVNSPQISHTQVAASYGTSPVLLPTVHLTGTPLAVSALAKPAATSLSIHDIMRTVSQQGPLNTGVLGAVASVGIHPAGQVRLGGPALVNAVSTQQSSRVVPHASLGGVSTLVVHQNHQQTHVQQVQAQNEVLPHLTEQGDTVSTALTTGTNSESSSSPADSGVSSTMVQSNTPNAQPDSRSPTSEISQESFLMEKNMSDLDENRSTDSENKLSPSLTLNSLVTQGQPSNSPDVSSGTISGSTVQEQQTPTTFSSVTISTTCNSKLSESSVNQLSLVSHGVGQHRNCFLQQPKSRSKHEGANQRHSPDLGVFNDSVKGISNGPVKVSADELGINKSGDKEPVAEVKESKETVVLNSSALTVGLALDQRHSPLPPGVLVDKILNPKHKENHEGARLTKTGPSVEPNSLSDSKTSDQPWRLKLDSYIDEAYGIPNLASDSETPQRQSSGQLKIKLKCSPLGGKIEVISRNVDSLEKDYSDTGETHLTNGDGNEMGQEQLLTSKLVVGSSPVEHLTNGSDLAQNVDNNKSQGISAGVQGRQQGSPAGSTSASRTAGQGTTPGAQAQTEESQSGQGEGHTVHPSGEEVVNQLAEMHQAAGLAENGHNASSGTQDRPAPFLGLPGCEPLTCSSSSQQAVLPVQSSTSSHLVSLPQVSSAPVQMASSAAPLLTSQGGLSTKSAPVAFTGRSTIVPSGPCLTVNSAVTGLTSGICRNSEDIPNSMGTNVNTIGAPNISIKDVTKLSVMSVNTENQTYIVKQEDERNPSPKSAASVPSAVNTLAGESVYSRDPVYRANCVQSKWTGSRIVSRIVEQSVQQSSTDTGILCVSSQTQTESHSHLNSPVKAVYSASRVTQADIVSTSMSSTPKRDYSSMFIQKSKRTPVLKNSSVHSIASQNFPLNLTESVQKLLKPLPSDISSNTLPATVEKVKENTSLKGKIIVHAPDVKTESRGSLPTDSSSGNHSGPTGPETEMVTTGEGSVDLKKEETKEQLTEIIKSTEIKHPQVADCEAPSDTAEQRTVQEDNQTCRELQSGHESSGVSDNSSCSGRPTAPIDTGGSLTKIECMNMEKAANGKAEVTIPRVDTETTGNRQMSECAAPSSQAGTEKGPMESGEEIGLSEETADKAPRPIECSMPLEVDTATATSAAETMSSSALSPELTESLRMHSYSSPVKVQSTEQGPSESSKGTTSVSIENTATESDMENVKKNLGKIMSTVCQEIPHQYGETPLVQTKEGQQASLSEEEQSVSKHGDGVQVPEVAGMQSGEKDVSSLSASAQASSFKEKVPPVEIKEAATADVQPAQLTRRRSSGSSDMSMINDVNSHAVSAACDLPILRRELLSSLDASDDNEIEIQIHIPGKAPKANARSARQRASPAPAEGEAVTERRSTRVSKRKLNTTMGEVAEPKKLCVKDLQEKSQPLSSAGEEKPVEKPAGPNVVEPIHIITKGKKHMIAKGPLGPSPSLKPNPPREKRKKAGGKNVVDAAPETPTPHVGETTEQGPKVKDASLEEAVQAGEKTTKGKPKAVVVNKAAGAVEETQTGATGKSSKRATRSQKTKEHFELPTPAKRKRPGKDK